VFAFLSLSLLTALLSGYLIGYYSVLVNYYKRVRNDESAFRPDSMDVSWGLIGTNLAFSCASCLFGILGFLASFLGIRGGTPKGINLEQDASRTRTQQVPLVAPPQAGPPIRTVNVPTQIVNSVPQLQHQPNFVYAS
jgi:hypothetical protein